MGNDTSAKIYSDQRSLPIHLGDSGDGFTLPFKEKWRAPDAIAAVLGFVVTGSLVTANITNGASAFRILILGVVITVAAVWLLSKLPATRPSLRQAEQCWKEGADPVQFAKDHYEFARAFQSFPGDADKSNPALAKVIHSGQRVVYVSLKRA